MRKALPWIYLLLALVGAGLTWQANLAFIAESSSAGFELQRFISDASSNPASQSLSRDLLIGATAVSLWMSVEGPRLKIRFWWLGIVLSFSVAFACGAPFFLFLRERHLLAMEEQKDQDSPSTS
ncbi:DUF2834 domain-containing protein [Parasynechococcus sp.]|jgi:hypothetical protein|uniref:DUF2834 domain-containing protein n=1 Tax=Parasynechococcus sp. TaxID=3101203 RepID=UPI003703E1E8